MGRRGGSVADVVFDLLFIHPPVLIRLPGGGGRGLGILGGLSALTTLLTMPTARERTVGSAPPVLQL